MFAEGTNHHKQKTLARRPAVVWESSSLVANEAANPSARAASNAPEHRDDGRLVESAKAGNLAAFNELVLTYQDRVYRWVFSLVTDEDLAADLTQMTFILAYEKLSTFRGGSFPAWLFKIARNLCYDELRRKKRRPWISLDGFQRDPDLDGLLAVIPSQDPLPEDALLISEQVETIARLLERLPGSYQQVLRLVDIEALDYQEAAEALSLPLGTVKSRLSRARFRFRQLLLENGFILESR